MDAQPSSEPLRWLSYAEAEARLRELGVTNPAEFSTLAEFAAADGESSEPGR